MSRIGLLVPSSNTTVEPEFYRALPKEVTLHVARLYLDKIATDSISSMVADIEVRAGSGLRGRRRDRAGRRGAEFL